MIVAKFSEEFHLKEKHMARYKNHQVQKTLMTAFNWMARVPMISVLILIICLIRIASMSLEALYKEIFFRESASTLEMNLLIMKWRKSYILVRDLVAEMNVFFDRPIIIVVFITMLSSINLTCAVIVKIKMNSNGNLFDYILEIVTNLVCLCLLALVSEQLPQQVSWAKSI